MNRLKMCAWYLLFMAALHSAVGVILHFNPLVAVILDGAGTVAHPHLDRLAILWFMFSGALMFVIAFFALWSVKQTGTMPRFLGYTFLIFGIGGGLILPVSGFWLYIPVGLTLLFHHLRAPTGHPA